jgi:microcin C transport system substrate-binding protein
VIPQWYAEGFLLAYRGGRFEQPAAAPQYYQPEDWVLRTWWRKQ